VETPAESRQRPDMGVDGRTAQVLKMIVVEMGAVERRLGWTHLVQIGEVIVHKVGKRLRWVHA
jgi:hypothetical protein